MMPVHSRAMDDVQGSTSFAGGMDAGSDWPVCGPHQESQTSQHVCAIFGGALFGYFFALKKVPRLHRRTPSGFIRHFFAIAQAVRPSTDL